MTNNADSVMDAYSNLDDKEKAIFDKRYRELMKFRKFTKVLLAEGTKQLKRKAD